jgi:hypothetical protein
MPTVPPPWRPSTGELTAASLSWTIAVIDLEACRGVADGGRLLYTLDLTGHVLQDGKLEEASLQDFELPAGLRAA